MKVIVTDIKYDVDNKEDLIGLPETLTIDVPDDITDEWEIDDYVSDEISNITGFCHKGFVTNLD